MIVKAILFILAFVSWSTISISGKMLTEIAGVSRDSIQYLVTLFIALAYAQWYVHRFLSPLQGLTKADRDRLTNVTAQKYKKGFFAGTIGLGYLLALLYGFALLDPKDMGNIPNYAFGAIFFILFGTIAQARLLTATLIEEFIAKQKDIEQPPPN